VFLMLIVVALAGCATYQPPPLTAAHPASPDAQPAREVPASRTLDYTRAEADAIRVVAPARPAHGDHRLPAAGTATTVVGEGEVVATKPATSEIVVDHPEIKGFMAAMTMGYRTEPASLLATVKPGDRIRFTIDVDRRAIVHIERLK
jgi:Cu/Ag efflux protein CusF